MQRAYHHSTPNLDVLHRPPHRVASVGCLRDRTVPYNYPELRYEPRPEHFSRQSSYSTIQAPETINTNAQPRRRIAVACARCRRRKIRCSGDPGDNSGCSACKASGSDPTKCLFNRVGSQPMEVQMLSAGSDASAPSTPSTLRGPDNSTVTGPYSPYEPITRTSMLSHRASLPALQTHMSSAGSIPYNYSDSSYEFYSPYSSASIRNQAPWGVFNSSHPHRMLEYSPITLPTRHDSLASSLAEQSTPYNNSGGCEQANTASESLSAMTMGSSGTSITSQAADKRRLPILYTTTDHQPCAGPPKRAQGTANFRPVAVHDLMALPWTYDRENSHKCLSMSAALPPRQMQHVTTSGTVEPAFGYQFPIQSAYSPEVSPTSGPELAESFAGLSTDAHTIGEQQDRAVGQNGASTLTTLSTLCSLRAHRLAVQQQGTGLHRFGPDASDNTNSAAGHGNTVIPHSASNGGYSAMRYHQQYKGKVGRTAHASVDYSQTRRSGSRLDSFTIAGRL
ncbi:hypothetical protein AMS68_003055 [Peltaster fructicola]|uniref:Zn(2)-C6 fungal-type domain-containing protein n=1 Tax=Peltaster fructicola TaxID=286661 RepID=A0A6H0XSD6_9PEZI|nr:hypothetical protein AMS68_003055 [Peltaster fructicola]